MKKNNESGFALLFALVASFIGATVVLYLSNYSNYSTKNYQNSRVVTYFENLKYNLTTQLKLLKVTDIMRLQAIESVNYDSDPNIQECLDDNLSDCETDVGYSGTTEVSWTWHPFTLFSGVKDSSGRRNPIAGRNLAYTLSGEPCNVYVSAGVYKCAKGDKFFYTNVSYLFECPFNGFLCQKASEIRWQLTITNKNGVFFHKETINGEITPFPGIPTFATVAWPVP